MTDRVPDNAPNDTQHSSNSPRSTRRSEPHTAENASTASKKIKPMDEGAELELSIGRREFALGALVRLRVPVRADDAEPGRNILTDIDVLAVDVDNRLRISRSCLECKSGKGQSGEPDRLLWLAGLRKLLGFDRAVLVRRTISRRGRSLARKLDVEVMDTRSLDQTPGAIQQLPARFAHLAGDACVSAEARTDAQLHGLKEIGSDVVSFLRSEAFLAKPPAILSAIELLGKSVERQGVVPAPTGEILAGHALVALIYAALQDAGRLDIAAAETVRSETERDISGGVDVASILERADELVEFAIERVHREYVGSASQPRRNVNIPRLSEAVSGSPAYLDDYIDLVERLHANPTVARSLLQTAELVCFDALLGGEAWRSPIFREVLSADHRGLILIGLRTLGAIAGPPVTDRLRNVANVAFGGPRLVSE